MTTGSRVRNWLCCLSPADRYRIGVSAALASGAVGVSLVGLRAAPHAALLLLLAAGFVVWLSPSVPRGPTAFTLLVLAELLGLTGGGSPFTGFGRASFFFIVGVFSVASALQATGTASRLSRHLLPRGRALGTGYFLWRLPLLLFGSAAVISSATARMSLLSPVSRSLVEGEGDRRGLAKYLTTYAGHVSPVASRAFLSGGPGVIVAADLMARAGHPLDWFQWVLWMGVPVLALVLLTALVHWLWLRPSSISVAAASPDPLRPKDRWNAAIVVGMLVGWIFGPAVHVGAHAIAVLGGLAMGLLHGRRAYRHVDWDLVVFCGATLSFGYMLIDLGTAAWVGSALFGLLERGAGSALLPLGAFLVLVILRVPLNSGVSYSAVVFPIILSMEPIDGLNPLHVALLGLLAGSIVLVPVQSMPAMIGYSSGHSTMTEALASGLLMFACAALIVQVLALPYWQWLGRTTG